MSEHEKQPRTPETRGISELAAERSVEIGRRHEAKENTETSEARTERATQEAKEKAESAEKHRLKEPTEEKHQYPIHTSKMAREKTYKQTMSAVRSHMSPPARVFSQVIHNPAVEQASDFVGKTIARPDAILSGSVFALVAVAGLYITAKFIGFSLSGFETIAAFVIGWILGIIFDAIKAVFRGRG